MNGLTEAELREMVRASIARAVAAPAPRSTVAPSALETHASFVRLSLTSGDTDGACLIEPSVRCNHCGYCVSYGH
jgi:hypothetical protein